MRDALGDGTTGLAVRLGERCVTYRVEFRGRRKTVGIRVDPDGTVAVYLPQGFSLPAVPALLRRHERFVTRQLDRLPVLPQFKDGGQIHYLGRGLALRLDAGGGPGPLIVPDGHLLHVPAMPEAELHDLVLRWLIAEAAGILPLRLQAWGKTLAAVPRAVRIGGFRSRWGYCRADGLIALNWRLIQAPVGVADYVMVHELMHLRHPHHQADFWRAVRKAVPDADESRRWLREEGRSLFW